MPQTLKEQIEIKFRQPIIRNGKFQYWHYWGFLSEVNFSSPSNDWVGGEPSLQYIGLKDKNSKEIYEGDIIQVQSQTWLVEPIGSVERDGFNYGLCVSSNGNGENYFIDKSILAGEVIGNIYENPELLEAK